MRHLRWLLLSLLVALAVFAAAQPEPGKDLCVLQGTVKLNDGTPFKGVAIDIQVDGKPVQPPPVTDDGGAYTVAVPAGQAAITVLGITKQAKLEVGKVGTVDFEIPKEGLIVVVTYADGTAVPVAGIRAACRTPKNPVGIVANTPLGPNRYWFRNIPADATAFSVIVTTFANIGESFNRRQFTLDKPEPMRVLNVILEKEKPISLQVAVLDADNKPLANTNVRVTLSYESPLAPPFWDDNGNQPPSVIRTQQLGDRATDDKGLLNLGMWPARKYTLTMRGGALSGPNTIFELKAGQEPIQYALNLKPRDVTQVVFDASGKPLPNAAVTIGYCAQNQLTYQQATADARGQVTWKAVPPVTAVVWGKGVPVGMLPPDATKVIEPLAPPAAIDDNNARWHNLRIKLLNIGDQPTRIIYSFTTPDSGMNTNDMDLAPDPANPPSLNTNIVYRTQAPSVSFIAMTKSIPARVAILPNTYLPPMDDNDQGELSVAFQPGTALKGHLTTKAGPVKGVSQFRVVPVKAAGDVAALLTPDFQRRVGLLQPQLAADGAFAVALPGAGAYRLIVDLYDEATTPLPELLVDVPDGGKTVEVKLPDPMLTVPAGTLVNWLTPNSPASPRRMIAAAHANPTPVFGPKDQLLALWFRPTPDKLVVWNGLDHQQSVLTLRAVTVNVLDEAGKPFPNGNQFILQPLLPVGNNGFGFINDPLMARANSESAPSLLNAGNSSCAAIWTGRYLLPAGMMNNSVARFIPVDVTPDGPTELNVTMKLVFNNGLRARNVGIRYARDDFDQLRRSGADSLGIFFDTTLTREPEQIIGSWVLQPNSGNSIQVPMNAKTMTLVWPGVGVMREVALPAYDPNQQGTVTLPAWEPGATITGKILSANGQPCANRRISAGANLNNNNFTARAQTDANGVFTIKGLQAGTCFISNDNDFPRGSWILTVPEKGLPDITLKMTAQPLHISGVPSGDNNNQVWWFPDGGQPISLPARWSECQLFESLTGSGMLWATDGARGEGRYLRFTMRPGDIFLSNDAGSMASGPSLGIYFPLDLEKGTPGPVTLIGQDDRVMLKVRYRNITWQASTLLNRVVGQINAVPPGKYRVIVETNTGNTEALATVTDNGGKVELTFPNAPFAAPAPAPVVQKQMID